MSEHLPFQFARDHGVLIDGDVLLHRPGLSLEVLLELQRSLSQPFSLSETTVVDFQQKLTQLYQDRQNAAQEADDVAEAVADDEDVDLGRLAEALGQDRELLAGEDDAPVIRLLNAILAQAVREEASDVHLEPFENHLAVRFRCDGVLKDVLAPKLILAPLLVSRIKVMARLDIAEKRLPQDGRISVSLAGHGIDIRVSTIPSAYGERVVLRLLDQSAGHWCVEQLSMPETLEGQFKRALQRPHGIVLVTGPTGSGKTTSLYAGLSHINDRRRNILTIEDPVEYLLPGIGQTQVNSKIDMDFARGLRAILRQDPDVVMVGEIRDRETAAIAVQASLTGHLVLSTLHTNTAIGAVTRLVDMGVEPFLLASSLNGLMAQRLVRLLCDCKEERPASAEEARQLQLPDDAQVCSPVGCERCHDSGYRGRTALYEWIELDQELRDLIHQQAGEAQLVAAAREQSQSIIAHGRERVLQGETSVAEVVRVTSES